MDDAPPTEGGVFSAAARILKILRDILENRIELFLVEVVEERVRLFDALLLGAVGMIFALMTLLMLTLTVVAVFWESHRLLVLILATVIYAGAAVAAFLFLRARLQRWRAFSATLEQIKKDRACLEKPS
jgi:uncharacterized membrane protein YqjE